MEKKTVKRKRFTGTVSLWRTGQSGYTAEVKTDCGLVKRWYGWFDIPGCFRNNMDPVNNMHVKIAFDARLDLSYITKVEYLLF